MDWARILAYITGTVDEELLLRKEYLTIENRILRAQIKGRLLLSDAEKETFADIGGSSPVSSMVHEPAVMLAGRALSRNWKTWSFRWPKRISTGATTES